MARVRPRTVVAILAATLAVSAGIGFVVSRSNDEGSASDDSVVIDAPGEFPEPGSIGTAPELDGEALPMATLEDLQGNEISTGDLIGAPMVLNFWFKDCVPCALELPAFAEVHAELGDEIRFVGIDPKDAAQTAAAFAAEKGVEYELYLDRGFALTTELQLPNFPATLFVAADGRVVELHLGAFDADGLRARSTST